MIVEWINTIFTLLGIELPQTWYFFGLSISINDLVLIAFILLFSFFVIEIIIGFKCWLKKLTHLN